MRANIQFSPAQPRLLSSLSDRLCLRHPAPAPRARTTVSSPLRQAAPSPASTDQRLVRTFQEEDLLSAATCDSVMTGMDDDEDDDDDDDDDETIRGPNAEEDVDNDFPL